MCQLLTRLMMMALEQRTSPPEKQGEATEEQEHLLALMEKVLGIDFIVEKILHYAIRQGTGKISGIGLSTLRLVQKSWLETITKLLQKSKEPLFKLVIRDGFFPDRGAAAERLQTSLAAFVSTLSSSTSKFPPFIVEFPPCAFRQENHENLSKLLVDHGAGLVQLKICIPRYGGTLKFIFPSFSLPNLQKLTVNLSLNTLDWTEPDAGGHTDNVSHFVNCLLNSVPALSELIIPVQSHHRFDTTPLQYHCFTLPPTLTILELMCDMTSEHLQLLIKSQLPLLTSLTLSIPPTEAGYRAGLLFKILDNFRGSLRKLTFSGKQYYSGPPRVITNFHFPVMEKLEELSNLTINCELGPLWWITALERYLPQLKRVTLTHQTTDMFRKWTENSKFSGVEQLKVHLADENFRDDFHEHGVGVDLEMMERLHRTFPNVRKLEVTCRPAQVEGLRYIFVEMGQKLAELKIVVVGTTVGFDWSFWDGLLVGAPPNLAAVLRESPDMWAHVQLTNVQLPSVKSLKEVTTLSLVVHPRLCENDLSTRNPLISDLTFHFALLQMPKLRNLLLGGKFWASDGMAEMWRGQGRALVHRPW